MAIVEFGAVELGEIAGEVRPIAWIIAPDRAGLVDRIVVTMPCTAEREELIRAVFAIQRYSPPHDLGRGRWLLVYP